MTDIQPEPTKKLVFRCRNGVWEGSLWVKDRDSFFTEKDFNQLSRLLTVQRNDFRRQANLAWRQANEKMVRGNEAKSAQAAAEVINPSAS